jgi:hypothetical protein
VPHRQGVREAIHFLIIIFFEAFFGMHKAYDFVNKTASKLSSLSSNCMKSVLWNDKLASVFAWMTSSDCPSDLQAWQMSYRVGFLQRWMCVPKKGQRQQRRARAPPVQMQGVGWHHNQFPGHGHAQFRRAGEQREGVSG